MRKAEKDCDLRNFPRFIFAALAGIREGYAKLALHGVALGPMQRPGACLTASEKNTATNEHSKKTR